MRPFFLGALDMFWRYQGMEEGAVGGTQPGGSLGPATQQQGGHGAPARQLRQGAR